MSSSVIWLLIWLPCNHPWSPGWTWLEAPILIKVNHSDCHILHPPFVTHLPGQRWTAVVLLRLIIWWSHPPISTLTTKFQIRRQLVQLLKSMMWPGWAWTHQSTNLKGDQGTTELDSRCDIIIHINSFCNPKETSNNHNNILANKPYGACIHIFFFSPQ